MKSYLFTLVLLLLFFAAYSQEENYLLTTKGEKVILYTNEEDPYLFINGQRVFGNMTLDADELFYFNKDGKQKRFSQKSVKELHFDGKNYVGLPIKKSGTLRLHEIIATNDKYILTQYFHNGYFFYIFDKLTTEPLELRNLHSNKEEKDLEHLSTIARYFSDCPKLMVHLKENLKKADYKRRAKNYGSGIVLENFLLGGVSSYQCE